MTARTLSHRMKPPMRRWLTAVVTAGLVIVPAAASAHPALNPDQASTSGPTQSVLVIAHGCSPDGGAAHDEEGALATTEVAIRLADGILIEPGAVDGWETSVTTDVVTWTDAGGATTDVIEFPVTVTVAPDAAPEYELAVFQQCEQDASIRWTADSEEFPGLVVFTDATGGGVDPRPVEGSEATDLPAPATDLPTEGDDHVGSEPATDDQAADAPGDRTALVLAVVGVLVLVLLGAGLAAKRRQR